MPLPPAQRPPVDPPLERRLAAAATRLPPAELRVARFLRDHREEALISSAVALAARLGTSDATVIRAVQGLGYGGMGDLRKRLADELHYSGDKNDTATMNIWLHKQVMLKLAESGGKVPDELRK